MAVEKLEIETYFGKCKCCLKYGYLRTMWEQHTVEDEIEIYGQMLTQCFSIPWTIQGTEEEDQICEDCIWKLREAHLFKKQVLRSQEQLGGSDEDLIEIEDTEIKSEPDENYDVEYLDEDILDNQNHKDNSDVESLYDERESHDREDSQDGKENQDEDDVIFDDAEDEDYDESQDQDLEDEDDEDFARDVTPPRKRKLRNVNAHESESDTPKPKWPKKLPKEERWRTYRQYTDEDLKKAVESVISRKMNQKQAAKLYRVPRKTLSAKIQEVKSEEQCERPRPLTPTKDEIAVSENRAILNKHRDNIRTLLTHSNATPIRGHWGVGYACSFCNEQFKEPSRLKKHTQTHGDISEKYKVKHVRTHLVKVDVTGLKCLICNTRISKLEVMMRHLKTKHDKPMHFDIKSHIVPYNFENDELKCVRCAKIFNNFKNISEHMNDVHFRNYECDKCPRGFVNKSTLITHSTTHRTGQFACAYCAKIFNTNLRRTEHERILHMNNSKTRKCGYCDEKFVDIAQKIKHEMSVHKSQPPVFKCDACDKTFSTQRNLQCHVKNIHLMHRPYKCTEDGCGKAFFVNTELQAHILSHGDEKPFACAQCKKVYKSRNSLYTHLHSHNDRREFKCRMCSKRFVMKENLKLHLEKIHDIV